MNHRKALVSASLLLGCGLLGGVLFLGYQRTLPAGSGQDATAKTVFAANCARCHALDDSSRPGARAADPLKGPNLSGVGADPRHTRQWFLDYIRDPQAEDRTSAMPKFGGKLTEGELLALADYLASHKGN